MFFQAIQCSFWDHHPKLLAVYHMPSCGKWCKIGIEERLRLFNHTSTPSLSTAARRPTLSLLIVDTALHHMKQNSDAYLDAVFNILRGWGGLIFSVTHSVLTIAAYLCCRCRRVREVRRIRNNLRRNPSFRSRRRLVLLSDGSVTDVADLENGLMLNDSVFMAWFNSGRTII